MDRGVIQVSWPDVFRAVSATEEGEEEEQLRSGCLSIQTLASDDNELKRKRKGKQAGVTGCLKCRNKIGTSRNPRD